VYCSLIFRAGHFPTCSLPMPCCAASERGRARQARSDDIFVLRWDVPGAECSGKKFLACGQLPVCDAVKIDIAVKELWGARPSTTGHRAKKALRPGCVSGRDPRGGKPVAWADHGEKVARRAIPSRCTSWQLTVGATPESVGHENIETC
jgi:hypothetical protein